MTRDPREALIAWRASTGYSQTEVGALFGVSKQAAGNWEQGRARVPARVQKRLRAEGWLARRFVPWTGEHDTWLCDHAGEWPLWELAAQFTATWGIYRSPMAMQARAQRLHVSTGLHTLLTRAQIAHLCGVSPVTVRRWVELGFLLLPHWAQDAPKRDWAVPPTALETFIDTHAVRLDAAQMPASRYRVRVLEHWTRNRWLDVDQIAAHLSVHRGTVWKWITAGHLPASRQPHRRGCFSWRIRVRDLTAFLQRRAA